MKNHLYYLISFFIFIFSFKSFSQCNYKFTYFVDETTNDVRFFFINQNLIFPDSITWSMNLGDGSAPVQNTPQFIYHYSNQINYYVCLSGNVYDSTGVCSCSFTFCDSVLLDGSAQCHDSLLSTDVLGAVCPLNCWCPVCGCDGVEYDNRCEAERHGVKKYSYGRCPGNTNIWPYSLYVDKCAGHIETKPNGFTSTCYVTTEWDFGDGTSLLDTMSAVHPVSHYYTNNGVYNLCAKIIDPLNIMQPQMICTPVVITNANSCHASFNYIFSGDTLFLTNSSTGNFSNVNSSVLWGVKVNSNTAMISMQMSPKFYLPGGNGSYNVCLTIKNNDCSCYHDTCFVVYKNNSTIIDLYNSNVSVYPNPSEGVFTFDGIAVGDNIDVFDVTGRIVFSCKCNTNGKFKMNLLGINTGIYFYRITSENKYSASQGKLILH